MESNSSTFASKGHCFSEAQEGLALLAAMEAGYSGQNRHHNYYYTHGFGVSKVSNTASLRGFYDFSPRSARFYDARYEDHQPHFLESCFLCRKQLANKDIFMYRGDTPFCSEECRQEQIDMDEAKEKNRNLSSSMKAMRNNKEQTKSTTPDNTKDYSCVIAAA